MTRTVKYNNNIGRVTEFNRYLYTAIIQWDFLHIYIRYERIYVVSIMYKNLCVWSMLVDLEDEEDMHYTAT